jgi:hypothetical protein
MDILEDIAQCREGHAVSQRNRSQTLPREERLSSIVLKGS